MTFDSAVVEFCVLFLPCQQICFLSYKFHFDNFSPNFGHAVTLILSVVECCLVKLLICILST